MKQSIAPVLVAGAVLLFGALSNRARAATIILHDFTGSASDGAYPVGSLTLSGSRLYGMTGGGGSSNNGAIFSMNTDGTGYTALRSFRGGVFDGADPYGSLTLSGSKLYGVTVAGGNNNVGVIFSMNIDGSGYHLLHSFIRGPSNDGSAPFGSLTLLGSKLYGMTSAGGVSNGGTIFRMNTDGSGFSLLYSFSGNDGYSPLGSLALSGSTLYGMTQGGGLGGKVFRVNVDGSGFGLLHSFTGGVRDGDNPQGSLTLSGSTLYGMTTLGGSGDYGTIFSLNTDGTGYHLLHTFSGGASDGAYAKGSLTLSGSTLYGMTQQGGSNNKGTLFSIGIDGTGYRLLESFGGGPFEGANPYYDEPALSADGSMLYGMTLHGGKGDEGVVFSRSIPEPGASALLGLGALLFSTRRRNAQA